MREKDVLRETYNLWMWLSKNPGKFKSYWPGWRRLQKTMKSHCPCCHYALKRQQALSPKIIRCVHCLLIDFWPSFDRPYSKLFCLLPGSPYLSWGDFRGGYNDAIRKRAALKIAYAARYRYRKLEEMRYWS